MLWCIHVFWEAGEFMKISAAYNQKPQNSTKTSLGRQDHQKLFKF